MAHAPFSPPDALVDPGLIRTLRRGLLATALALVIFPAAAQERFLQGGQELSSALKEYAASNGWKLTWKASEDYFLDVDQILPGGGVVADVEHVLRTYQDRGALEDVGLKVEQKSRRIELVRGAKVGPVTDKAIATRASMIGKNRLGVMSPAALELAKPIEIPAPTQASLSMSPPPARAAALAPMPAASLPALPTEVAAAPVVAAAPAASFTVMPGDLMSVVLERWVKGTTYKVVWQAESDYRLQAGANFQGKTLMQAVEDLAAIVAKTQGGIQIRAYRNGVILVTEAGK